MIRTERVFDRAVMADLVKEPTGGAKVKYFLKFPGGEVAIGRTEEIHHRPAAVVDAGQLRRRQITVSALFVRNAVGIGAGILV